MAANLGTGTTITFGTSAWAADIMGVNGPEQSRPSIDTSHLGTTGYRTFTPGDLIDAGEVSLTLQYDGASDPPIDQAAETITIAWGGSANTSAFSGYMTNFAPQAELEELMTATATIKVTGAVTGF